MYARMTLNPYLTPYTNTISKWIKGMNVSVKIINWEKTEE